MTTFQLLFKHGNFCRKVLACILLFLTANEIHFIVGENAASTDDKKMKKCAKQFKRKNSRKADAAKTGYITKSPGKEAQSVTAVQRLNLYQLAFSLLFS